MGAATGRIANASRNTAWAIISQGIIVLLNLFSRKVFLDHLGAELLGVSSLFSDVLLLFSFADLGIGTAIMFSMYRPLAENDEKKIRSLLLFYRTIYNYVILALIVLSLAFIPFIFTIKTTIPIRDLLIYYGLFQFNNIILYLWAFRESYVVASQKERVLTRINLVFQVGITILLMVAVILYSNYLVYLVLSAAFVLLKRVWVNQYLKRKYPITVLDGAESLEKREKVDILKKSYALLVTKIGNLLINQTDSLVVSVMVNVTQWGFASNYLVIKKSVFNVTDKIYSGMLPSMGNLLASDDKTRFKSVFYLYDFLNAWLHTFCLIAFVSLSSPFVELFFGKDVVLPMDFVLVFFLAAFLDGLRTPVSVVREASGSFEADKWYTMIAAAVNLIVSLPMAHFWGLNGVFFGTIAAMIVLHVSRTVVLFRDPAYEITPGAYLLEILKHLVVGVLILGGTVSLLSWIGGYLQNLFLAFLVKCVLVLIVPNALWVAIYGRSPYFKEFVVLTKRLIHK